MIPDTPSWTELTDLAASKNGGKVLFATDDFFATADNLLLPSEPIFIADKFTEFGKWMDGWESRRKRTPGHDWCVIKLGFSGRITGIDVETTHFTGNFAPRTSIQAAYVESDLDFPARPPGGVMGSMATPDELKKAEQQGTDKWETLHEMIPMKGTSHNFLEIKSDKLVNHIRLNIFPDGGVSRLRVYGYVQQDWAKVPTTKVIDLLSVERGGRALGCSDKHYGEPKNLLGMGRGVNMGDGWETKRKTDRPATLVMNDQGHLEVPGDDWVVLKLGHPGNIQKLEVDTCWFKGNFPESCIVYGTLHQGSDDEIMNNPSVEWKELLPRSKLQADHQHYYSLDKKEINNIGPISHVKMCIFPDGGVSRLRCYGTIHGTTESSSTDIKVAIKVRKNTGGIEDGSKLSESDAVSRPKTAQV